MYVQKGKSANECVQKDSKGVDSECRALLHALYVCKRGQVPSLSLRACMRAALWRACIAGTTTSYVRCTLACLHRWHDHLVCALHPGVLASLARAPRMCASPPILTLLLEVTGWRVHRSRGLFSLVICLRSHSAIVPPCMLCVVMLGVCCSWTSGNVFVAAKGTDTRSCVMHRQQHYARYRVHDARQRAGSVQGRQCIYAHVPSDTRSIYLTDTTYTGQHKSQARKRRRPATHLLRTRATTKA